MTERPILFSGPMVPRLLDGSKTMTRRVVKAMPPYKKGTVAPQELRGDPKRHPSPYFDCYRSNPKSNSNPRGDSEHWCWWDEYDRQGNGWLRCPYGKVGDRLWVKETFFPAGRENNGMGGDADPNWVEYSADLSTCLGPWRPSLFMPRWASRLTLEIESIYVERVGDISEEDAIREGITCVGMSRLLGCPLYSVNPNADPAKHYSEQSETYDTARMCFAALWDSLHAKPKPVCIRVDGKRVLDHYVSFPFSDIQEVREHRGKPWRVCGNPWVWVLGLKETK